ncbi:MAG: hypothetical protein JWM40_376 [Frankiales bacterium]|nr:hypothetical protein [Frankiales bacterium]
MTKNIEVAKHAETLAAFLTKYPELPQPTHYNVKYGAEVQWLIWDHDLEAQKRTAESVVRFLPGKAEKEPSGDDWFKYSGVVDGVQWEVVAKRDAVCRRVVTGTETLTRRVPDPAAPLVEVTETVETVEWQCEPLLTAVV